ncbi:centrosomal protein of 152 kDa isoform X1 [Hypanus sabinus]|uniref:centrosomal protein of 152 kDa isoform X1 n=1 Tax=Hypanus sabinus TaxID=79690 RepID=UPI0028C4EA84|nr:centrosomal protein of 152 kDa isoform X1 [Hypanus sabinus]
MSMDFDSAALPTQHEDEEYDKEDYEREQELHQLLMTDLPDDMLEDSRDIISPELNFSNYTANNRGHQIWEQKGDWNDHGANNSTTDVCYSAENPVHKGQSRHFITNETAGLYKVKYNPYPAANPPGESCKIDKIQSTGNRLEPKQSKFLDSGEGSMEAHRFAQLQILYDARGRMIEEMQQKGEECAREIRYLNHQLAMTKGEKEGITISCQELKKLLQDAKEHEVQLEGQIKALESRIEDLSASEKESLKNQKIAEAAMESMQQQLSELSRSESLTRAREQHENIIGALKEKHEAIILTMQQTLDATSISLEEQKENCKRLQEQVKQLQREQEEAKVEKADIINGLTKSLEMSQQQCRDLLQTGSIQEISELRIQLQQVQSARNVSDQMNKALQEELTDLKEQIALYESAAKINAIIKEAPEELEGPLSDSFVALCIKNENLKIPRLQSSNVMCQGDSEKTLCKDEVIQELKTELERSLSNIKAKRHQVTQLQNEAKENQKQIAELKKMLQNAEKLARSHEVRAISLEKELEAIGSAPEKTLQDEIEQLTCETQDLRKEIEGKQQEIEKLTSSEKQFKEANQELYNEMRQVIQDFEQDKQDAIDRCERIHQQHHEDSKCRLKQELMEQHELEKAQLTQLYEQQLTRVNAQLEQLNQEMSGVQECYIAICKEKDSLESQLKKEMSLKLTTVEQELKRTFLAELQENLNGLNEKHESAMQAAKQQWMREEETNMKLQVENQLKLAKAQWQEEQQKVTECVIRAVETEWRLCLHKAMEQKASSKREEVCENQEAINTEVYICQELEAWPPSHNLTMEQQTKEERITAVNEALQKIELELQKKYEDNLAKQVEIALTKAHDRWLEELCDLPEYRANLQIEEMKWKRKYEKDVAMQISIALKENEEKWKQYSLKEIDEAGSSFKIAELQEKIDILEHKLERQKQEASAAAKTELAKVQAQWNKEKQEEINRIYELNENDYQTFLDEHRNKLNEVLKAAKEDFLRQRSEILAQKETELNLCIIEKQKEWSARQEEQIRHEKQQYESELVAEIEHYLRQISKHFIINSNSAYFRIEEHCNPVKPIHAQTDKVKDRLQKVCTKLVEDIIETLHKENKLDLQNALIEMEKQHKEYKTQKEAQLRKLEMSELQIKQELDYMRHQLSGKENFNPEYQPCDEQHSTQVKQFQQECHQLKKKLDKMGQQLQLTVQEHKIYVLNLKEEHERTIKLMQNEKDELLKRLKENKSIINITNTCLQQQGSSKNSSKLISTKGLEEIRHQYLTAVNKIREDMLYYIQESKVRAAEMIRAEVLRERQQTARKMRKYYLTCLHQLLADGGNSEGAEKKIMSAASKLAAVAKAIETPLVNRKRDKCEIHKAQLMKKSSEPTRNISDNCGGSPASAHMLTNQSEKFSSSKDRIQQFVQSTASNASVPQGLNRSLFSATIENGTSGEHLSTDKQDNVHKLNAGISSKDASSLSNDAVSEPKYHKASGVASCQNSATFLTLASLNKTHVFSSTDNCSDKAPLQRLCRQMGITPLKETVHLEMACDHNGVPSSKYSSKVYICPETLTGASSDICESPERDEGSYVVNFEAANCRKIGTFGFRPTGRNTCHLDDYSMSIKCSKLSAGSTPSSYTNMQHKPFSMASGIAQLCPSVSSAASGISSFSVDENAFSGLHIEQEREVLNPVPTINNSAQLGPRTETCVSHLTKGCSQKKHPLFKPQNTNNIQQDSGFDSPFFNFR